MTNKIIHLLKKDWFVVLALLLLGLLCLWIGNYIEAVGIIGIVILIACGFFYNILWDKAIGLTDFLLGKKRKNNEKM